MATEYTETVNQILKDTSPQLPGAIRTVADRELRLAMREFFERSYAWTTIIEDVDAPAGDVLIAPDDNDANAEIIAILNVAYKGSNLSSLTNKPSRDETSNLPLFWFVTSNPDEFKVFPYLLAAETSVLDVTVALIPDQTVAVLPRQITLKYYDAIVEGFLARMLMHPNKPYSAPALAQQLRRSFVTRIGYYIAQRKQGYNGGASWRYPQDFQVRRLGRNG